MFFVSILFEADLFEDQAKDIYRRCITRRYYVLKLNATYMRIHRRVTGTLLKILSLYDINRSKERNYTLPIIRTTVFNRL